jgi:hypothetical protein
LNGITFIINFMKIYQAVQKSLVGDTQTNRRQTGDLISLFLFTYVFWTAGYEIMDYIIPF